MNRANPKIIMDAAARVGGVEALASLLGLSRQAIYQWKRVPAERVLKVEKITGVSKHELRPDIFGKSQ